MALDILPGSSSPRLLVGSQAGPASYAAGGFVIDLRGGCSIIRAAMVHIGTYGPNLVPGEKQVTINSPSNGQVTVLLARARSLALNVNTVTGNPASTTLQAASGAATNTEAAHTHGVNHDHPATVSATETAAGAAVLVALSPNIGGHTHSVDLPALGVTASGVGTAHSHVRNNIYDHNHSVGTTATLFVGADHAAGTDLSGSTFRYWVVAD